jgi:predicted anti-sigma-YlaC factor YlaD
MTPCWHMKALLAARCDQRLSGLLLRYVELHLSQCNQCRAALAALIAMRQRLLALRDAPMVERLSPDRAAQLEAAYRALLQKEPDDG